MPHTCDCRVLLLLLHALRTLVSCGWLGICLQCRGGAGGVHVHQASGPGAGGLLGGTPGISEQLSSSFLVAFWYHLL
jgi:hypothetical protein